MVVAAIAHQLVSVFAQKGLDALSDVFRRGAKDSIDKITEEISEATGIDLRDVADGKVTDDQWIKLKEFELQRHAMLLQQAEIAEENDTERSKIAAEDRKNARDMQVEMQASSSWLAQNFIYLYAFLITLLTFGFIGWVVFGDVFLDIQVGDRTELSPASLAKARIVDTVIGFLLGVSLSAVIQFFFGSSDGSSRKNKTIASLLQGRGGQDEG